MMILLAVVSGTGLAVWRGRRAGVDPEMIFSLAFWMILPAIVGARAFYVTEYWSEQYWPVYREKGLAALSWRVVNVAKRRTGRSTAAFFGGVAGHDRLLAASTACRVLATADLVAPSLMLGLAIGRIGCLLNGCCFGGPCDLPWAVSFPRGSPPYVSQVAPASWMGWSSAAIPRPRQSSDGVAALPRRIRGGAAGRPPAKDRRL